MPQQNPQSAKHPSPASPAASQQAAATPSPGPESEAAPAPPAAQQQQEASQTPEQQGKSSSGRAAESPSSGNQNTEGKKISCEDIQLVQNLIERCLQLYMNQNEVINTLLNQAKIEPGFTSLVWQKLEEQNPEFFKAYYTRLKLKRHIMTFNHLLEQQVHLMQKMRIIPTKVPMQPLTNGIHNTSMGQVPMGYPVSQMSAMPAPSMPVLPHSPVVSGGNPLTESFPSAHASPGSNSADPSLMMQCTSAGDIADSAGASNSNFPFGNITDMAGMSLDTPFVSHEPQPHDHHNAQNGIVSFDGADEDGNNSRESLGALGHLPRNFSLSDLAAELELETLGDYTSPFMSPEETESFLQSPDDKHNIASCVFSEGDKLLDDLDFGDLK